MLYILTTFGYGCNLGPNQTARHTRGLVTSHMLSYTNRRHVDATKIAAANRDLIGAYNQLHLPKVWGTGKTAAADGSKVAIYENNLMSEYHIRYGGYGVLPIITSRIPTSLCSPTSSPVACGKLSTFSMACSRTLLKFSRIPFMPIRKGNPHPCLGSPICWASS